MTSTPIADQANAIQARQSGLPADDPMSAFAEEQAALAATRIPDGVVTPGSRLPDTALLDPFGAPISLHQELANGRAVVVFYRGAWCPFCNLTLAAYQSDLLPALSQRGVTLIAISPQSPDGSLTMREKHDLTFKVLSDPGNALAARVGIVTAPSEKSRAAQLQLGFDVTAGNADGTTAIPMPTTLLVDSDAIVRWVDVRPNYSARSEPAQIIAALDELEQA